MSRCRWWFASPRYNRWVGNVESERVTGASIPDNRSSLARRAVRSFVPGKFRPAVVSLVRPLLYRGNAVHCACCDGDFSRFIPHQGRPYAKCPRCGALERHRLLVSYLRERTDLFAGRLKVLHVAPEWCLQLELRRLSNLDYVSADLDSPLATSHFELFGLSQAFNHLAGKAGPPHRLDVHLRRVLRADGRAIIMSPIDPASPSTVEGLDVHTPEERRRVYWQRDHLRRYGRDFADRVASRGFSVDTIRYIDQFDATQVQRQGLRRESALFSDDDIFICHCATAA